MENEQNKVETAILNEDKEINSIKKLVLIKPKSKGKSRGARTTGGFASLINSKGNGKRLTFAKAFLEKLNIEEAMDLSITPNGIAIGNKLPKNAETFPLRTSGNNGVIYSYSLVEEVTEQFDLDFSDRVSITFTNVEFINDGDYFYAEIKMK